ncbi:MAG: general secretion pathway protein GspB [Vibrio sp.]
MSQVMKALKQSEQAYQAQLAPSAQWRKQVANKPKASKWLLLLCLILPIAIVIGVMLFGQGNSTSLHFLSSPTSSKAKAEANLDAPSPIKVQPEVARHEQTPVTSKQLESTKQDKPLHVTYLRYPEFSNLQPLPQPKPKPVVETKTPPIPSAPPPSVAKSNQSGSKPEDDVDLSNISPELAEKFRAALQATPLTSADKAQSNRNAKAIQLDSDQQRFKGILPAMNFQAHVYVSDASKRWVKVNGKEVHLGQWLVANQVRLESMTPRDLTVSFQGQYIQIPALYEWKG